MLGRVNMAKKPKLLSIGDWIEASTSVEFVYEQEPDETNPTFRNGNPCFRVAKKTGKPVSGQVVGGVYRQLGEYRKGCAYSSLDGDEYEQPQLEITGTVFVYQVREGFLNKPVDVLPEDIKFSATPHCLPGYTVPRQKSRQPAWTEECREEYRQAANQQPRKNGKFAKS